MVSSAERDGLRLIAVTLNAPDDWNDHAELLDYGFANYEAVVPILQGEYLRTIPCIDGREHCRIMTNDGLTLCVPKGEGANISVDFHLPDSVSAPVAAGQKVGSLTVKRGEEILCEYPLCSSNAVPLREKKNIWKTIRYIWLDLLWKFRR